MRRFKEVRVNAKGIGKQLLESEFKKASWKYSGSQDGIHEFMIIASFQLYALWEWKADRIHCQGYMGLSGKASQWKLMLQ